MEWVKRASDYRTLTGKRDLLGYPLGVVEGARLAELERFFEETMHPARCPFWQREQTRVPVSVVVSVAGQCGTIRGRARDISGDGVYVETDEPMAVGSRAVIAVTNPETAEEWQFGAEVVRIESQGMGLRFVGIPLTLRIGHRRAPVQRTPVRRAA